MGKVFNVEYFRDGARYLFAAVDADALGLIDARQTAEEHAEFLLTHGLAAGDVSIVDYVMGAKSDAAPMPTTEIAKFAAALIEGADKAGLTIDNGNVIDLLADNITAPDLRTLRAALSLTGYAERFNAAIMLGRKDRS